MRTLFPVIVSMMFLFIVSGTTLIPVLPLFYRGLGFTALLLGTVVTIAFLAGIPGSPISGILSDRLGRPLIIVLGEGFSATSLLLLLVVPELPAIIVSRVLAGISTVMVLPALWAFAGDAAPKEKTGVSMALVNMSASAGFIIGPIIGSSVGQFYGFGSTISLSLAEDFVGLVLAFLSIRQLNRLKSSMTPLTPAKRHSSRMRLVRILRDRRLMGSNLSNMCEFAILYAWLTFLPVYLNESLHVPTWLIGVLITAETLSYTVLQVPYGKLIDRFSVLPFVLIGLPVYGLLISMLAITRDIVWLFSLMISVALVDAPVYAANRTNIVNLTESSERGLAMGVFDSFSSAGGGLGPFIAAILASLSLGLAFLPSLGFGVTGGLVALTMLKRKSITATKPSSQGA